MDCRTTEKRKMIVKENIIEPVAHIQLLAGQEKHSDAGQIIKDEYYIFEVYNQEHILIDTIQCGLGAAKDFLRLINHKGLPLFNPLKVNANNQYHKNNNSENNSKEKDVWDATAKQLYNAIMWLIIIWDAKSGTLLFEFMNDVLKYKSYKPYPYKIKRVNSVIQKDKQNRTLTQMIDEFRYDNDICDSKCEFNLLTEIINREVDENGKANISYF